jgi:hypothetical protein
MEAVGRDALKMPVEKVTVRSVHCLPAPQQQPAFAPAMGSHHRAGAKELLAPNLVEGRTGMLQHVEFIEHGVSPGQGLQSPRSSMADACPNAPRE